MEKARKIKVFIKSVEDLDSVKLTPLQYEFIQRDLDDTCRNMEMFKQHENEKAFENFQDKLSAMSQILFSIGYMLVDENNKKVSAYDFDFSS